jgi:hypothetical protein
METKVTHVLEEKKNGTKVVRNFFFNEDKTNYMTLAHSYFSKQEKKQAKADYKYANK